MANKTRADGLSRTAEGKVRTVRHPEGISEGALFFNEEKVAALIIQFQKEGEDKFWQAIVLECNSLIEALIRYYRFTQYDELDAVRGECIIKLRRVIEVFDPSRGRAFSHISWCLKNFLISFARNSRRRAESFETLGEKMETAAPDLYNAELSDHFKKRVLGIETRFTAPLEKEAVRFLIVYFLLEGPGNSRNALLPFLIRNYGFSKRDADTLYSYAIILLREALFEEYPVLGLHLEAALSTEKGKTLFALAEAVGKENLVKLIYVFGGLSVRLPKKEESERLRVLARTLNNPETFLPSAELEAPLFEALNNLHLTEPLF
jgi:hypothetical protein